MALTIIIIMLLIVGWILTLTDDGYSDIPWGIIGGMIGVIIPIILLICMICAKPTAMDVYQGKTTLEITYKDGVAIDSVVVFKYKEK